VQEYKIDGKIEISVRPKKITLDGKILSIEKFSTPESIEYINTQSHLETSDVEQIWKCVDANNLWKIGLFHHEGYDLLGMNINFSITRHSKCVQYRGAGWKGKIIRIQEPYEKPDSGFIRYIQEIIYLLDLLSWEYS